MNLHSSENKSNIQTPFIILHMLNITEKCNKSIHTCNQFLIPHQTIIIQENMQTIINLSEK